MKENEHGRESEDVKLSWRVEAEKCQKENRRKLRLALSREPYPFLDRPLASFGITVTGHEPGSVFIARPLLDELRRDTAHSLDAERADILIGRVVLEAEGRVGVLIRDASLP